MAEVRRDCAAARYQEPAANLGQVGHLQGGRRIHSVTVYAPDAPLPTDSLRQSRDTAESKGDGNKELADCAALKPGGGYGGDALMTITEHEVANFRCGNAFGVDRSDDAVLIQIAVFATRTTEQKKALYRQIAARLSENPGVRPQDVFVNVLDAAKENWSVGHGLAQFA